jgi:transglutaminase-like putative cysteine protease
MRRYLVPTLILLLLLPLVQASPNTAEELRVVITTENTLNFEETGPNPYLEYAEANYTWLPSRARSQEIQSIQTDGDKQGNVIALYTEEPTNQAITTTATLTSKEDRPVINRKHRYPITTTPVETHTYLQKTELIDYNDDIQRLTNRVIGDTDDLRVATDRVATWVTNNIEYNLSTTNAEASIRSTTVLERRQGVCDELTNLFIAMMRSVGVPARYVSGLAYTDSDLFEQSWGPHGWAEVYFPDVGWVPYDPTYKQYGYVDASHIVFNKGTAGQKYTSQYTWLSRDLSVTTSRDYSVEHTETSQQSEPWVSTRLAASPNPVGFGGVVTIQADLRNNEDAYITPQVRLQPTQSTETLTHRNIAVTLPPGQAKTVKWQSRIDPSLDPGYVFTIPFQTSSRLAGDGSTSVESRAGAPTPEAQIPAETSDQTMFCAATPSVLRPNASFQVSCNTENICHGSTCAAETLRLTAPQTTQPIKITADQAAYTLPLTVIPRPDVSISASLNGTRIITQTQATPMSSVTTTETLLTHKNRTQNAQLPLRVYPEYVAKPTTLTFTYRVTDGLGETTTDEAQIELRPPSTLTGKLKAYFYTYILQKPVFETV